MSRMYLTILFTIILLSVWSQEKKKKPLDDTYFLTLLVSS